LSKNGVPPGGNFSSKADDEPLDSKASHLHLISIHLGVPENDDEPVDGMRCSPIFPGAQCLEIPRMSLLFFKNPKFSWLPSGNQTWFAVKSPMYGGFWKLEPPS